MESRCRTSVPGTGNFELEREDALTYHHLDVVGDVEKNFSFPILPGHITNAAIFYTPQNHNKHIAARWGLTQRATIIP